MSPENVIGVTGRRLVKRAFRSTLYVHLPLSAAGGDTRWTAAETAALLYWGDVVIGFVIGLQPLIVVGDAS